MKVIFGTLVLGTILLFSAGAGRAEEAANTIQNPIIQDGQAAAPVRVSTNKKARVASALKPGQFAAEADAKASCPNDKVVWVNIGTKIYHQAGTAAYGTTKRGAYMCEKNTASAGFRPAKNGK